MIKYEGKRIQSGEQSIDFEYDIRKVEEWKSCYIVLLAIPFDDNTLNNIYCLDKNFNLKWRVEDIAEKYPKKNNLPYEGMSLNDGVLKATDFYGRCYTIDVSNGRIIDLEIVK